MIGSIPLELLVDTGAAVSLLNASVWKGINNTENHIVLQQWSGKKLVGVNGTPLSVKGCVHTCVGTEFEGSFVVSDGLVVDAIVGLDFIQKHNCVIDSGKKLLRFPAVNLSVAAADPGFLEGGV